MDNAASVDDEIPSQLERSALNQRIAVDVDGTLITTDLLWESALRFSMSRPWHGIQIAGWLLRGKGVLKTELAARVPLDAALLPYRQEVLVELRQERARGAHIVLATASALPYAQQIAHHLGLFDTVIATVPNGSNLRSEAKAEAITEYFGSEAWTYYGDARADLKVWSQSAGAVLVDAPSSVRDAVTALDIPYRVLACPRPSRVRSWLKQIRVHQWAKNLLVLLPLLASHLWTVPSITSTFLAFLAFCFAASSVYVWNDLKDLDSDRSHPTKRSRPFAAGLIPIPAGVAAGIVLALLALTVGLLVGWLFTCALIVYAVVTTVYTAWLKRKVVVDIVTLALLYTWRIVAGCAATMTAPSIWILAFSIFFFFSLALMKRYAELANHAVDARGRGYLIEDANLLMSAGIASAITAILVLVLYLDSPQVAELYSQPYVMWALVPLLLAWLMRTWMLTTRGKMDDDPVLFAVRDRTSQVVTVLAAVIVLTASI